MGVLEDQTKKTVQSTIDQNIDQLKAVPGFVSAEPGFPIVDGELVREPAIIVLVVHKRPPDSVANEDRVPRQLGEYRVAVMQASPMQQLEALSAADVMSPATSILSTLSVKPENLTYKALPDNPIDQQYTLSTPFLCHVGPDAGWPVLKPFLQAAQVSLSVAMCDFNADYISKVFIDCIRDNDLKAQLTWDNSMTAPETEIRAKLKKLPGLTGGIVLTGSGCRFALHITRRSPSGTRSHSGYRAATGVCAASPTSTRLARRRRPRGCTRKPTANGTSSSTTRSFPRCTRNTSK